MSLSATVGRGASVSQFPARSFARLSFSTARQDSAKPTITERIKREISHYVAGSKQLAREVSISSSIFKKYLHGDALKRREILQLKTTSKDLLRLVPFSIFVIVPFLEFALPIALKVFPGMLPSTFTDLNREKRLAIEAAIRQKRVARSFSGTLARDTLHIPSSKKLLIAEKYLGKRRFFIPLIQRPPIQAHLAAIEKDDARIVMEGGPDFLTDRELSDACFARGIPVPIVSNSKAREILARWLDGRTELSVLDRILVEMERVNQISIENDREMAQYLRNHLPDAQFTALEKRLASDAAFQQTLSDAWFSGGPQAVLGIVNKQLH